MEKQPLAADFSCRRYLNISHFLLRPCETTRFQDYQKQKDFPLSFIGYPVSFISAAIIAVLEIDFWIWEIKVKGYCKQISVMHWFQFDQRVNIGVELKINTVYFIKTLFSVIYLHPVRYLWSQLASLILHYLPKQPIKQLKWLRLIGYQKADNIHLQGQVNFHITSKFLWFWAIGRHRSSPEAYRIKTHRDALLSIIYGYLIYFTQFRDLRSPLCQFLIFTRKPLI